MIVLLDTNFVTLPAKFKIDIINEIKRIIPNAEIQTVKQVINELRSLKTNAASVGLELIKKNKIKTIEKIGKADDILIEIALEKKAIIATNDKELKKRALEKKIRVIFMRKKKTLDISGGELLV